MNDENFPQAFRDLEPFRSWVFETESEWVQKYQSSSITEIRCLHDAVVPRLGDAVSYLNQHPLHDMPEEAKRLFNLLMLFIHTIPVVEQSALPSVIAGHDVPRFEPLM